MRQRLELHVPLSTRWFAKVYPASRPEKLTYTDGDYWASERAIADTLDKRPIQILGYGLMPRHRHLC